MGLVLFVASTLTRLQVLDIAREMIPFLGVHLVVILLITYFPALSMTLPRLLGYY
jgi:TRAP-type C4-dicarboxylate transport system permease large subunit